MTKMKIGGVSTAGLNALEPHIQGVYARPGSTFLAVAEYEHVERTQPGPRSDKEPQVTVVATSLEVAAGDLAEPVRELLRALYRHRTASGTLDEESGQVELSENTIRDTPGLVDSIRAAELTVGLKRWADYITRVRHSEKPTVEGLLRELDRIRKGMEALVESVPEGSIPPAADPATVPAQRSTKSRSTR